jgi:hypothetical protein
MCLWHQGEVAGQLPALVHQLWYAWYAARWSSGVARSGGAGASALAFQEGAAQSNLIALGLLRDAAEASLSTQAAKALQLRLAARHVAR